MIDPTFLALSRSISNISALEEQSFPGYITTMIFFQTDIKNNENNH